jgi:NADH-quinone oxidoreductase subunit J
MSLESSAHTIIWYCFALLTAGSAAYVVLTRNIVRAAFALVAAFIGIAAQYVFLQADFLAAAQVLIYAGGITVLLLFGVMLTHRVQGMEMRLEPIKAVPALVIVVGFLVAIGAAISRGDWHLVTPVDSSGTTALVGEAIMTHHLLPFEEISVLLLVVLVGALFIARPGHTVEEDEQ